MARPLRLHIPDGWYHLVSRGNGGDAIYRDDDDRRRFLGLLAALPERFGTEIHAFVLMDNHYHLLARCRRADVSETLRWLQTSYAVRFNWAHRRRGHVFQGRFRSVLIHDEAALDSVARYIHLNPVRTGGLGLSKEDQRRARVVGCEDPGAELIARRLAVLRGHRWSSWPAYAGLASTPPWLSTERIQAGCGGRRLKEQREALIQHTEAPIRQGRLESPWEGLVARVVLGDAVEAAAMLRRATKDPGQQQAAVRQAAARVRPRWIDMTRAAEAILGRPWEEMATRHGDWGRDGVMAVATRHLGWRLVEAVRELPGVSYGAATQGIRRFWRVSHTRKEMNDFAERLRNTFPISK